MYYIRYLPIPAIESLLPVHIQFLRLLVSSSLVPVVDRVLFSHKSRAFSNKPPAVDVSHVDKYHV